MYNQYYYPYGYFQYHWQPKQMYRNASETINIPFLPIIGDHSKEKLVENIYQSIVDEATAAEFYARLVKEAPDTLHIKFIKHAYEDELIHLEAFMKLYTHLTGTQAQYEIMPVQYQNYKEGILHALNNELEAAEFYRDVKLSSTDPLVRDTFFLAIIDELEHSTQFGVLYNTL